MKKFLLTAMLALVASASQAMHLETLHEASAPVTSREKRTAVDEVANYIATNIDRAEQKAHYVFAHHMTPARFDALSTSAIPADVALKAEMDLEWRNEIRPCLTIGSYIIVKDHIIQSSEANEEANELYNTFPYTRVIPVSTYLRPTTFLHKTISGCYQESAMLLAAPLAGQAAHPSMKVFIRKCDNGELRLDASYPSIETRSNN